MVLYNVEVANGVESRARLYILSWLSRGGVKERFPTDNSYGPG